MLLVPLLSAGSLYVVRLNDGTTMLTDSPRAGQEWELWWNDVDPVTNLPDLSRIKYLDAYDSWFVDAADNHGVPAELLKAVCVAESHMNPKAVSKAGARGLMQLMPATAESLQVTDPYDPSQNITAGTQYLKQMLERYGGDIAKALAAYNAGPARVDAAGGVPPIPETQEYVRKIMGKIGPPRPVE